MKKLFSLFALVLVTFSVSAQSVRGDLNGDGAVTTTDVTELYNIIFGTASSQEENVKLNVGCVKLNMIPVKGGTFQMGGISSNERPTHSVTLSDYYIGETEVTQALWESVMGSNPSNFKGLNRPVEQVSWYDCQIFISKLNDLLSSQLPTGYRFRLPTEAEWEYAARGGTQSNGYTYSGSNSINEVACYNDNQTHDVATKVANELGIYDLSGNVFEWCQDWLGDYSSDDQINPTGPVSGSSRVFRGGCCTSDARDCRVYSRNGWTPSGTASDLGLRLVLSDQHANLAFNVGDVSFSMVYVSGGTFQMGATEEQGSEVTYYEKPVHSETVGDFWIGKTEVTQALWKAVMGNNPSEWTDGARPVERVSFNDCQKFVQKLNSLLSDQLPSGCRFRLPSEAEWEYAARGGNKSKHYKYSGSDNLDDVAWYASNSNDDSDASFLEGEGWHWYQSGMSITHQVGRKEANELGIYDMSGNVWEWCEDQWREDYNHNYDDSYLVIRGGGYGSPKGSCRVSCRTSNGPANSKSMGLRLVLSYQRANHVFSVGKTTFTIVAVDGGTFQMGSTSGESDEQPVHSVTLSDYYIGGTEVTQALWESVMGSNTSQSSDPRRPVEKVSWDDCLTFISKLNELTGMTFRLPTEAEWEFAARGGTKSMGYAYSGSNNIDDVAWYSGNSYSLGENDLDYGTHYVGTKAPNELGIYDMTGNVFEWCQDWYGDYSSAAQTNPTGPTSGSYRVVRGGNWRLDASKCRVSSRTKYVPSAANPNLGLRLAL